MNNTINKFEKEIRKLDKYAILLIILFIIIVLLSPYIFTRNWTNIDFSETGDIGSTIGGITAPFVGMLSALLVFLSFRAQINANKYQIESIDLERKNRQIENEITFIYHRLEEIKDNNLKKQFTEALPSVNGFFDEIIRMSYRIVKGNIKEENQIETIKYNIRKIENEKANLLLILSRQLSLYLIVSDKLNEIKKEINVTQAEYVESSLRFEYLNSLGNYIKLYINKTKILKSKDLLFEDSIVLKINNYCIELEKRLNPSA